MDTTARQGGQRKRATYRKTRPQALQATTCRDYALGTWCKRRQTHIQETTHERRREENYE